MHGKILCWPEFYAYEAATDTPCCVNFESLYRTFDDAKFIYTKRDIEDWVRSVKSHSQIDKPEDFKKKWVQSSY
jgi:hypothetical protein